MSFRCPVILWAIIGIAGSGGIGFHPAAAADADGTQTVLRRASALRAEEKPEEALEELRQAARDLKESQGDDFPGLLPLYDLAAEILFETGQFEKAEPLLARVIDLRETLIESGRVEERGPLASSLLLIGKVHASQGEVGDVIDSIKRAVILYGTTLGLRHSETMRAQAELGRAVQLYVDTLGPEHEATLVARRALADVQESLGDYAAAVETWQKVYAISSAALGTESGETSMDAERLSEAMVCAGRASAAVEFLTERLEKLVAAPGDTSASRARVWRIIGELHLALERFTPATNAFREALRLDETLAGRERNASVLLDRILLARVDSSRGDDPDWDEIDGMLRGLKTATGDRTTVAEAWAAAGALLIDLGDSAQALPALDRASEAIESVDEPSRFLDRLALECRRHRVRALLDAGQLEKARGVAEDVAAAAEVEYGPAGWKTLQSLMELLECATLASDAELSRRLAKLIVDRRVPRTDMPTEELLTRLLVQASQTGEPSDAGDQAGVLKQFEELRIAQFGSDSPAVAQSLVCLGNACQQQRDWAAAVAYYEQALSLQERVLDPQHPDIAATILPLSRAYRAVRRLDDAERVLERALGIWEQAVGPTHPATLATVKALALAQLAMDRPRQAIPLMERLQAALMADPRVDDEELARLLVRLAQLHVTTGERSAVIRILSQALELDWWNMTAAAPVERITSAAKVLAEIAATFDRINDPTAARSAERRARKLASLVAEPQGILDAIDEIIAGGT